MKRPPVFPFHLKTKSKPVFVDRDGLRQNQLNVAIEERRKLAVAEAGADDNFRQTLARRGKLLENRILRLQEELPKRWLLILY